VTSSNSITSGDTGRHRRQKWDTSVAGLCLQQPRRFGFELGAVCLLGIDGSLLRVGPAEQGHQLMFRGASFGAALRAELAQSMCAELREAGLAAALFEPIAKGLH
jgi:hypothetical protein